MEDRSGFHFCPFLRRKVGLKLFLQKKKPHEDNHRTIGQPDHSYSMASTHIVKIKSYLHVASGPNIHIQGMYTKQKIKQKKELQV